MVIIDSLYQQMPVEEIVGSENDSPHFFCGWAYQYSKLRFPPPSMLVLGEILTFEGELIAILYFLGEEGHTRCNTISPFSGSVETSCGIQKYLPYIPTKFSQSGTQAIYLLFVCECLLCWVAGGTASDKALKGYGLAVRKTRGKFGLYF